MFERVVLCTDLSVESESALVGAHALRYFGASVVVLTHMTDVFHGGECFGRDADDVFERQAASLESFGFKVHVDTIVGYPALSLDEVAKRFAATLIVVGESGRVVFDAPFSGSPATDLLLLADTPVLVTTTSWAENQVASSRCLLERVLYCTDFSESAESAFECLEGLVPLGVGSVTLLHVQDVPRLVQEGRTHIGEFDRVDRARLAALRQRLTDVDRISVECEMVHGSPSDALAERASGGDYSLVILGNRGRGSAGSLLGASSDRLVRESSIPVLLVPAKHAVV